MENPYIQPMIVQTFPKIKHNKLIYIPFFDTEITINNLCMLPAYSEHFRNYQPPLEPKEEEKKARKISSSHYLEAQYKKNSAKEELKKDIIFALQEQEVMFGKQGE
mmetsp:Transcript_39158/g.37499  ORF Transcript_39158/g.37499 Transcript_39158/m.37499 type:complete len:106 (-) Transcript_39158:1020-1337(-)